MVNVKISGAEASGRSEAFSCASILQTQSDVLLKSIQIPENHEIPDSSPYFSVCVTPKERKSQIIQVLFLSKHLTKIEWAPWHFTF